MAKTLDDISKQLSKKGDSWLEKISKQLESKGATGKNDPFGGFKIPKLTDIAKGLTFGLAPGLIKKSVSGMQIFIDSLNNMTLKDADASLKIVEVLDDFSYAFTKFAEIPWGKAFKGTLLLKTFANRFTKIGSVLGDPSNLEKLRPFRLFAKQLGEPLKLIGDALNSFSKINWIKIYIGSLLLERSIKPIINTVKLISKNKKLLESFGGTLEMFAGPLSSFAQIFNEVNFVKLIVGSLLLKTIIKPIISAAEYVSKNKKVLKTFGDSMANFMKPLTVFAKAFDKIGNALIKASASLLIVAGALALSAISFKLFGDVQWSDIGKGITSLVAMSAGLLILSKVSGQIIKAAAAVAIVGASLGIAALSFKLFSGVDFGAVAAGVGTLALIMGGLVAMGVLLTGPQMGAVLAATGIMALVGVAMIPFAYSLKKLSEVKWDGFDGIFTALSKLAAGAALLTFAIPGMVAGAVALIPFALGLQLLSSIDWNKFEGIDTALQSLANGVKEISFFNMIKAGYAMVPFAAGIALLRIAVGKGKTLPTFLEKFNTSIKDLKGDSLLSAAKGILALSGALVSMAGAEVVSGAGTLIGKILRFGSDSPIEQLIKLSKHGYNLSILGTGVADLASGLKALAGINSELSILETLADKFKGLESLDSTGIKAFAEGINALTIALNALSQLDGKLGVLDQIPYDKLKSLSESIKPGSPLIQIINGQKESQQSKETAAILKQSIQSNAPTVGSQLGNAGAVGSAPVVVINNNNGGNITNNSSTSSNVNNNGSVNTPIITASASGLFTSM